MNFVFRLGGGSHPQDISLWIFRYSKITPQISEIQNTSDPLHFKQGMLDLSIPCPNKEFVFEERSTIPLYGVFLL